MIMKILKTVENMVKLAVKVKKSNCNSLLGSKWIEIKHTRFLEKNYLKPACKKI